MQFIMEIQNQIASIEKALQDSITKEGNRSLQWVDLDDQDRDNLAMFLSRSKASKKSIDHSICRNVTKHQLKGNIIATSNVQETKDMVELRLDDTPLLHEEPGQSNLQSARQSDTNCACALDVHLNGFTATGLINKDSEFAPELAHRVAETRDDWCTRGSVERATGHKRSASAGTECGAWKIAIADDDIGNNSSNCRSERIRNGLNFWSLFSNLNITPKLKLSKSGMKKWKDGEASTIHSLKDEQLLPASNAVCHVELVSCRCSGIKGLTCAPKSKAFPLLQSAAGTSRTFHVFCAAKPHTVSKVCDIVKKQLALPSDSSLTPDSKFATLGADSLDTVEIVMALEEEFKISVEEENSENITTVQEAADLIESLLEKKAGSSAQPAKL